MQGDAVQYGELLHMGFWDGISWDALHDPIPTVRVVPEAVRYAIADLRKAMCDAALGANGGGRRLRGTLRPFAFWTGCCSRRRGGGQEEREASEERRWRGP